MTFNAGGKVVSNTADMCKALTEARAQRKYGILMRVKARGATKFLAPPHSHA